MSFESVQWDVRVNGKEKWLKVFYHNSTGRNYFVNESEAKYSLDSNKYSILANITNAYKHRSKFEFIIYWPTLKTFYHWRQTINPLLDIEAEGVSQARGFELIHPNPDPSRAKFGGLVKSTILEQSGSTYYHSSLLDGRPGVYQWYYSIGMYTESVPTWYQNGIPANGASTDIVSLWLLLPGVPTCKSQNYLFTPIFFISIYMLT